MKGHVAATFWAFGSGVQAALLHNWAATGTPSWIPTETGTAKITSLTTGISPKPTRPPGFVSEQDQVIELFRRQGVTDTTPWVNDQTCGWLASTSSRAILCGSEFTCATNNNDIVACVSGTFSPFFRVCMDYSAVQQGQCDNVGPETGCCNDRASPACATWIWTGKPARSQYGCAARSTIYSVMDVPQFVLDSLTRSTSSSTKPTTIVSTTPTGTAALASPTQTAAAPGDSNTTGGNSTVGTQTSTTTNLAPIIGGAVGGLAALVILVLLLCCCMRKRRNKNSSTVNKSKTRNNTTVNYYTSQENQYNTNSNTIHEAKGSLGNDAMYERNLQGASDTGGSGGGGGGAVSAIFCCARGRSDKKEKKGDKSGSLHSQHSGQGQDHHHHYHFDPKGSAVGAMSNLTTARNSGDTAGPQTIRAVGGAPMRSFSFEPQQQQQQQQQVYHTTGPESHSTYSMTNAPAGQMLPMPTSFSHSPLGIMSNYPAPRHELESASVVAAQTPPSQTYHQHIQTQQHPHQLQPGLYQPPTQTYYTSTSTHPAHTCNHHHHGSHSSPQGAPTSLPAAYMPPQYMAQPVTAMHTGVSAVTSNATGPGLPGDVSPQRLVSPSPMSSAASTIPSLHQQQQSINGVDKVYHPLQPPPSARTSAANMLRYEDGAQLQQLGQGTGHGQQQQHCSCCAANGHHHGMAQ